MNINKARHSSKLTDQHLGSILRIATTNITPDIDALAKKETYNNASTETECESNTAFIKLIHL